VVRSDRATAFAFAFVIALITFISVGIFISHHWWFPPNISVHGEAIDHQFTETFVGVGLLFIAAQLFLAYCVWNFRDRGNNQKVRILPGGSKLTVGFAIVIIGVELITLEAVGSKAWAAIYFERAPADAIRVEVQGTQFAFYFHYPGPDEKFGMDHVEKIDEGLGNFFGLDTSNDPDAKDDVVTATLGVPVNRPVELILRSKDVTHSFYVPELRLQQDMVPGMQIPVHFTATQVGRYEIVCTQLCGLGHYSMRAFLQVMSDADYRKWMADQAAAQ